MKRTVAVMLAFVVVAAPRSAASQTTFELTTKGAECKQNSVGDRLCTYRVGRDLEFSIAAVGQPDAGISFIHSDYKGDFYARMGMQHRCVIVQRGLGAPKSATVSASDFAFVSPRTGLVYRTWQECEKAR